MANLNDLETAINALLDHPLGVNQYQLIRQVEEKAYPQIVLQDNGVAQSLTMAQSLSVGAVGQLLLTGGSVTANADSSSAGEIYIQNTIFQINGNFGNNTFGDFNSSGNSVIGVTGTLTNNWSFHLSLGDVANVGSLTNPSGYIIVDSGAKLLVANNALVTDIGANSSYHISGTYTAGGADPFAQLNTMDGFLWLSDQHKFITPGSGTLAIGLNTINGNQGTFNVYDGSGLDIFGNVQVSAGGNLRIEGSIVNTSGSLTNMGGQVIVGPQGELNVGNLYNGGMLAPSSGSKITVFNGINLVTQSTLREGIGFRGFGLMESRSGLVMLDGTLDIMLDPEFNPRIGTSYDFLLFQPGDLSGTFATIQNDYFNHGTEKWLVAYNNAGGYVELEAAPAPEPGSMLLLGSGLLTMGYRVRRRARWMSR